MDDFSREGWAAESRALADGIIRGAAFWCAMNLSLQARAAPDSDLLRAAAESAWRHHEDVTRRLTSG